METPSYNNIAKHLVPVLEPIKTNKFPSKIFSDLLKNLLEKLDYS